VSIDAVRVQNFQVRRRSLGSFSSSLGAKVCSGKFDQELKVITRTTRGFSEQDVIPVRFVPMTGKAGEESR
jgi:hypothetical protein